MLPDEVNEADALRRAWPDAEPRPALDRAVRLQACQVLAQRRAELAAREEGAYPGWLLGLTAGLLVVVMVGLLPAGRSLWLPVWRSAQSLPLLPVWLGLVAGNLLAALVAPAVAVWRRSHAN